jgi:hypothetical protein
VGQPLTLRSETGDEDLDLEEFEARARRGEIAPGCLVRFPAITGEGFVPACELEIWKSLHEPRRAHFARAFSVARFPWITAAVIFVNLPSMAVGGTARWTSTPGASGQGGAAGDRPRVLAAVHRQLPAPRRLHTGLNMFVLCWWRALENALPPARLPVAVIFVGSPP